jgi:hypothetical protein
MPSLETLAYLAAIIGTFCTIAMMGRMFEWW